MSNNSGFLGRERVFKGPWSAFERSIARLLIHKGWQHVALIGGSGDNGGDIIASSGSKEIVYQVKFKSNGGGVGKEIVDDIKRAMEYYNIMYGCTVTNGYLTVGAIQYIDNLKKSAYKIAVLEGKDLLDIYRDLDDKPRVVPEMREYQASALSAILNSFKRGDRRALLVLATGLGKTFVAGKFLSQVYNIYKDFKILVLANKEDLIKQFEIALWPHLPKRISTHLWYGDEKPAYSEGVTLATFQSVSNYISSGKEMDEYNIVIIDECHHAGADTYNKVIETIDPDFILGMTATPFRTDEKDIEDIFGSPTFSMDIIEGMKQGFLARVDYRIFADNIDWEFITRNSKKSISIKDLNKKLFIPERDSEIIKIVKQVWQKERVNRCIFFCASINHCIKMERDLISYGFRAKGLYSGMDKWKRERNLREFRQGKIDALLTVDILNEGIDIPEVDLVVFLRVTHSRIIFLQQLGRGLRLSKHKSKVTVLDFVADVKRVASVLSLSSDNDRNKAEGIEVINFNDEFDVKFSDNTTKSFFEALISDKFEIEDFNEAIELFIP